MDFSAPWHGSQISYLSHSNTHQTSTRPLSDRSTRKVQHRPLSFTHAEECRSRIKSLPKNLGLLDTGKADVIPARPKRPSSPRPRADRAPSRRSDPRRTDRHGRAQGAQRRRRRVRRQVRRRAKAAAGRIQRSSGAELRRCTPPSDDALETQAWTATPAMRARVTPQFEHGRVERPERRATPGRVCYGPAHRASGVSRLWV